MTHHITDEQIDALCLGLTGTFTRKERDRAVARAVLALAAPQGEPLGYIPTDAIDQIKEPSRLITNNVPVLSYAAKGYTALYTAPAAAVPSDDLVKAARMALAVLDRVYMELLVDGAMPAFGLVQARKNLRNALTQPPAALHTAPAPAVPSGMLLVSADLIRRAQHAINWHLEPNSPDEHEATMRELAGLLTAAPTPPAQDAGLVSANGHLSTLLNESTQMLAQLRAMIDSLHDTWSNGGRPERGEFSLLDRVDDWLNARPSEMLEPQHATPAQPAVTEDVAENAARWVALSTAVVESLSREADSDEMWEHPFLAAFEKAIGDHQGPVTLEQYNAWVDAARAAEKGWE